METLAPSLFLALFVLALFALRQLAARHAGFSARVAAALLLGVALGAAIQSAFGAQSAQAHSLAQWIGIAGGGYVRLLQMLVMPLIFVSITAAFTRLQESAALPRMSAAILGMLLGTTAIAALAGFASTLLFGLAGADFAQHAASISPLPELAAKEAKLSALPLPLQIVQILPANVFEDFAWMRPTSALGVVIFAGFVGLAALGIRKKHPEEAAAFQKGIDALHAVVMRITTLVLRLTPYGICSLIAQLLATTDFAALLGMGKFIVASYAALAAVLAIHLAILALAGLPPLQYLKKAWPALSFAFFSRSSAGALPLNVRTQEKEFGVAPATANFSASFGLSIGQNGCAGVYPAMLATIVAPTVGIDVFTAHWALLLMLVVALSSFGVAGVGGGATFASLVALSTLNLPIAVVGLFIAVEPLIDMARTAVNVSGAMSAGIVADRWLSRGKTADNAPAAVP
jgi:L-cystine uptake protein TcyP (sodium:dicarboxylate symporter family)